MAEEKKTESWFEGWDFDFVEGAFVLIFLGAILSAVISAVLNVLIGDEITFYGYPFSKIIDFLKNHLFFLNVLGFCLAGLAAVGTFIFNKKGDAILYEEKAKLYPSDMDVVAVGSEPAPNPMKVRWEKIVAQSQSQNSSDWRLAIIEADIILDELLEKLQLPGQTMGEKLKAVEQSDFLSIDAAWEAHKTRNNIAHEGNDFLINQREVARIISLYESVFREFELI